MILQQQYLVPHRIVPRAEALCILRQYNSAARYTDCACTAPILHRASIVLQDSICPNVMQGARARRCLLRRHTAVQLTLPYLTLPYLTLPYGKAAHQRQAARRYLGTERMTPSLKRPSGRSRSLIPTAKHARGEAIIASADDCSAV